MDVVDPMDEGALKRLVARGLRRVGLCFLAGAGEWRVSRGWRVEGGEDGFGLGVAVGLPGEHGEVVGVKAVVVEAFAGEVVVDGAVGGFGGGAQRLLDGGEDGVGFGQGAEVCGSVVAGEFVVCGLVVADADVSVGSTGGVFYLVFGEEAVGAGGLVAAPVDAPPAEGLEVLVAVDVVAAEDRGVDGQNDLLFA